MGADDSVVNDAANNSDLSTYETAEDANNRTF